MLFIKAKANSGTGSAIDAAKARAGKAGAKAVAKAKGGAPPKGK